MAKTTPNPKKRGFNLPHGCKDLVDLLKPMKTKSKPTLKMQRRPSVRINRGIRVPRVIVRDAEGILIGEMALADALEAARRQGIDLVETDPTSSPPTCVLIDYGRFQFRRGKKTKF